jgi:hypothetical protein
MFIKYVPGIRFHDISSFQVDSAIEWNDFVLLLSRKKRNTPEKNELLENIDLKSDCFSYSHLVSSNHKRSNCSYFPNPDIAFGLFYLFRLNGDFPDFLNRLSDCLVWAELGQ